MPAEHSSPLVELAQKVVLPIVTLIGGFFSGIFKERKAVKKAKKEKFDFLSGLPPDAKAILYGFYRNGTHTMRADPSSPPMRLLMSYGITERGPGGGTYDAVDSYVSLRADIWHAMKDCNGNF